MEKAKRISQKDFQRIDVSELKKLSEEVAEPKETKATILSWIKVNLDMIRFGPVYQ